MTTPEQIAKGQMGEKVDFHCPYDETQLRKDLERDGFHICPCCHTNFAVREILMKEI